MGVALKRYSPLCGQAQAERQKKQKPKSIVSLSALCKTELDVTQPQGLKRGSDTTEH